MIEVEVNRAEANEIWRSALRSRSFVIGAVVTVVFVVAALVSFLWTPYDVTELVIADRFKRPSAGHWFGTDQFGRDIFSMVMVGARTSIAVAVVAVGIGVVAGVPLGLAAAAKRDSLLDEVIMRSNDMIFSFPALLIAILITAVFGPGVVNAIIAIGIFNTPVFARLARGAALSLWTRDFLLAARVAGKGKALISLEHILPNITNLLIVQGTIQFSLGILAEAGLSYVGLGAQPPLPSWGRMLAEIPDPDQHRATCGDLSRPGDRAHRSGAQSDGRRLARHPRSAPQAGSELRC